MGLRDLFRARPRGIAAEPPTHAIPLTPEETAVLVEALHEAARLRRIHRPDISGTGWDARQANTVARRAGIAAALGHRTVPQPLTDLHMYEYTLTHLRDWSPSQSQMPHRFQLLLTRMHMLAGMARIKGWTVRWGDAGMQWDNLAAPEAGNAPAVTEA